MIVSVGFWQPHDTNDEASITYRLLMSFGKQLIEERRHASRARPGHDRFGERVEGLQLMGIEELGRVRAGGGLLLRLRDRGWFRQVQVHRMLRVGGGRQREAGADSSRHYLDGGAPRNALAR
jgi:hypothetical protein